jgi:hypothetical protein
MTISRITVTGILLTVIGLISPQLFGTARAKENESLRSSIVQPSMTITHSEEAPDPQAERAIIVQRDPFIADEDSQTRAPAAMSGISIDTGTRFSIAPSHSHDGLIGIVMGEHPYALANVSGKTRILGIGDMFDRHKIARITFQGITLDDRSNARIPLLDQ